MIKRVILIMILFALVLSACGQEEPTPVPTEAAVEAAPTEEAPAPTELPPTETPPAAEAPTEEAPAAVAATVAEMDHQADSDLIDITWEWVRRDANGTDTAEIIVPNPENYTLTFSADGTFSTTLDCNNGAGVYATPTPGTILMELGPMTMVACPEGSLAPEMSQIFSPEVQNYYLEEDGQVLVFAWAADGPLDYFRNADIPLPGEEEVQSIPSDAIQLDLNGLADSYAWQVMPGSAIVQGPGGQGFPPYILLTFNGATAEEVLADTRLPRLYIFPTEAYVNLYQAAGNQIVADQVIRLGQLISTAGSRSEPPESPMPLLPPPNSFMDRWAQFLDLDFGVGEGVRYVSDSPSRQAIGLWTNETTGYYYQGLTTDQTFYVSLFWPVTTDALPNTPADASEEQTAALDNTDAYAAYQQETKAALDALAPADWSPDLASLDALAASLTFPLPGEQAGEDTESGTGAGGGEETAAEATATPTPAATAVEGASGTITAPDGVFVRSGPGVEFPDIDVAANGTTVQIIGKSEDGGWWAIPVPVFLAENETGWVSAEWVDAVDTAGVPVIEAVPVEEVETPQPALTGVTWQWVSTTTPVEETLVENPANYTITFNANGSASIRADCNNVGASYTAEDGSMSITLGPSTLAACADDSLDQRFLGGLEAAALYFFQGGDLYMDLMADGGTMRFSAGSAAAPAPAATATAAPAATGPTASAQNILFTLVSYGPEGAEQSPIEGTSITALFSGATVSGSAGCNDYTGTVTPVEDYFTIGSVAVTAKECVEPAGVMEQEQAFLAALQGTAGYQWLQAETGSGPLTGGRLFYNLADGTSGYLNFIAQ